MASDDADLGAVWLTLEGAARRQIDAGLPDGPLAGVPFALKDLGIQLAGAPTTNGSRYFADATPTTNSVLTDRYLAVGLVIAAKLSTSEFGLGPSADTDLHPATRNPWDPARIPGGSSTGSAVAVAARLLPIVHASDGGGSIRIPAACCGQFGFKPSRGRITYAPAVEGWSGMSTQHAISRSVRDSALVLDLTAGGLPGDPYACPPPATSMVVAAATPPRRMRIAAHLEPITGGTPDPEIAAAWRRACELLEALGHEVVIEAPPVHLDEVAALYGVITSAAVLSMIEDRQREVGRPPADDELLAVTRALAERGASHRAVDLQRARDACFRAARQLAAFTERFDAVMCPTVFELPPAHGVIDQRSADVDGYLAAAFRFAPYTAPSSIAGQPAMTIPFERTAHGLPIGMHVSTRFADEHVLFRLAGQLEHTINWSAWRPDNPHGRVAS